MQILDHSVLVLNILLDALQILRNIAIGLLLQPVDRVLLLLGSRQDVLNRIRNYEIFIRFQTQDRLLIDTRDRSLLVRTII